MIKHAQIQWQNGSPVSTQFDDIYFSKTSGIEETRYVFLQHNQLPARWIDTSPSQFTIAETGFGTGLNFLCAWQEWLMNSSDGQTLNFVSVEKFPLSADDLQQALRQWPDLQHLSDSLISVYPELVSGWHSIRLPQLSEQAGQVILHLYLGDIHDWLDQFQGKVDAWFLDGFAPSKNPDMWRPELFQAMACLSHAGTTVATFTAASLVRRSLQGVGFETQKAKGFGHKREMLYGQYQQSHGPIQPQWITDKPWFTPPLHPSKAAGDDKHAVVIGAGISGCASAYALASRGWQVTLIDQNKHIADGASGNAQGVLYAKLASNMNAQSEFYLAGYLFSLRLLKYVLPDRSDWQNCGVLQLAFNEKEQARQRQFVEQNPMDNVVSWVEASEASLIAGTDIQQGGLHFHDGAWVYPRAWCQALIRHANIRFLSETNLTNLTQTSDQQWHLQLMSTTSQQASSLNAHVVVMCNAHQAKHLPQLAFLPTKPIAGQVSQVASSQVQLNTVLCGESYVAPSHNGQLNFGASYRLKSDNCDLTQADTQFNLDKLGQNFPSVFSQLEASAAIGGRASVRCASPDYMPIVGAVCDERIFKQRFADLSKSKKWRFYEAAPYLAGLYVNLGHGSRGLSSAPLCAEIIAAQINNEPWPIVKDHNKLLSPNRFLVSQAIKSDTFTDR